MAVREFDGSDDTIVHAAGGLSAMAFGTWAAIFKTDTVTGTHAIAYAHQVGDVQVFVGIGVDGTQVNVCANGFSGFGSLSTGVWYLIVARKATGSNNPRCSLYNFTSTTWSHGNASAAEANWTTMGASGIVRHDSQGAGDFHDGRMAVRAAWSNVVQWTTDASGDSAVEAAGLHTSLQNWVDETPTALWAYNQDPLAAVDDSIGTSDQSSVVGTTVVTGDDPPGFTFDLGAGSTLMPRVTIVAG